MKGRKFLKVTGILMIIGGAFGIIGGIVAMIGAGALAAVLETSAGGLMLASALILASAVFQLVAGIMGVKNCDKPEKAQSCIVIGVIVAILSVAGNVISNVLGSDFNIINYVAGLIIPVLYIIGAVKNKEPA
ncbi:hypothetical protein [Qingrenia yutianensis]|uniref:Uncharacterized protein n=1 Tax=Qingrenia yutianensis TaxID=2763676 RepID=A0A926IS39_9FIRM|nr:hypothetical protein [Qingrenia yutianensis]MBC8595994.1 hypothetical protein [Qingrenia yutianensis]